MSRVTTLAFAAALAIVEACAGARNPLDTVAATRTLELGSRRAKRPGAIVSYESAVRARVLRDRGDLEDAAAELRIAIAGDPDDFLLRIEYAEVLLGLAETTRARHQLARALLLEPTAQAAWVALADVYVAEGRGEAALEAARHGARVEPREADASLWIAARYEAEGDLAAAAGVYERVLVDHPEDTRALLGLGLASAAMGAHARAAECIEKAVGRGGEGPTMAVALARSLASGGEPSKAVAYYEMALHDGADHEIRRELIALLLADGRRRSALVHILTLGDADLADVARVVERAEWLAAAGRPYEARAWLLEARREAPSDPRLRLALAKAELDLARPEAADELLRAAPSWPSDLAAKADELASLVADRLAAK